MEEEVMKLLEKKIENNLMIFKLQKQLLELQEAEKQKKRRKQDREQIRRDYNKR